MSSPSCEHFRGILRDTTKELTSRCERWSKLLEINEAVDSENNHHDSDRPPRFAAAKMGSDGTTNQQQEIEEEAAEEENSRQAEAIKQEEILGTIRSTIGQAKLLMSQRFKQFSELIDNCEWQKGNLPTRIDDLVGFWDMILYQVNDVMKKFESLEAAHKKGEIS